MRRSSHAPGPDCDLRICARRGRGNAQVSTRLWRENDHGPLPEGISHFRVKRGPIGDAWDPTRALVVSQFSPGRPWSAGTAMARNSVIIGLSLGLIVVEADAKGWRQGWYPRCRLSGTADEQAGARPRIRAEPARQRRADPAWGHPGPEQGRVAKAASPDDCCPGRKSAVYDLALPATAHALQLLL